MQISIPILYEDHQYIVFNKPTGLLVIPSPKETQRTLVNIVNKEYSSSQGERLHPCHRLDRGTSGAIIFAKGKRTQFEMMQLFHKKGVQKKYIAFVKGCMKKQKGVINFAIQDYFKKKYSIKSQAKIANTHYSVISVKKSFSVVEVCPQTGRTNQIRIHFKMLGHPLLGERVYAFAKDFPVRFKRLALHACYLCWEHPRTHKNIVISSQLPEDMAQFLKEHR